MAEKKTKTDQVFDALPTIEQMDASTEYDIGAPGWIVRKLQTSSGNSVGRNLTRLRAQGRAHIHRYTVESKNAARPMWVRGPGDDAAPPVVTPEERARRRSEITKRSRQRSDALRAAGESPVEQNLTQVNELNRSLRTVERARAAPRTWFAPLAEMQIYSEAMGPLLAPPQKRRGQGRESDA